MRKKIFPVLAIILGVLAAIGPRTFAPVCAAMEMKMRCYYTAQAELVVGLLAAALGIGVFIVSSDRAKALLSGGIALLGVLILLIPTVIIGVCQSPMMHCVVITKPVLILIGVLEIIFGTLGVSVFIKETDTAKELKETSLANN